MRHIVIALFVVAAAVAGCQPKGGRTPDATASGPVWRPRPVAVRIYPSTRFVVQESQALLEARIELTDEMGDPIKAAGEFRLELFNFDNDRQLYAWRVPVLTLDEQKTFYDPITRTYLLRLKLDAAAIAESVPRLRVAFTPAEGSRLQAEGTVRAK